MTRLMDALLTYGVQPEQVKMLQPALLTEEEKLEYQDLLGKGGEVEAVVEYDKRPILYVVRQASLTRQQDPQQLKRLLLELACRGGTTYLALVTPGMLKLYPCLLHEDVTSVEALTIAEHPESSASFFQNLVQGAIPLDFGEYKGKDVHHVLLSAIRSVSENLERSAAFKGKQDEERFLDVLALTGRALFARFLADRDILTAQTFSLLETVGADDLLSTPEWAAQTFDWMDQTFNGDLLPLPVPREQYLSYFQAIDADDRMALGRLSQIMRHSDSLATPLWNFVNFKHVPVGLLSEVYEEFAHRKFKKESKAKSVHYTPRHLAEIAVTQALAGLEPEQVAGAKMLDPAVGAGVFLVIGFKKLALAHWRATGERPTTQEIRSILYGQLRGLDVNRPALLLAALSLYLTAIELDPQPLPPEKLKFDDKLLGTVLFHIEDEDNLGSLGAGADEHMGYADIVLGNPPWTSVTKKKKEFKKNANTLAKRVIGERFPELKRVKYENPDYVPDLPFMWRSMEFCKPGGLIALIMHGRLLFRDSEARTALFASLQVTGIINGALLSDSTIVWPNVTVPFMILFARNQVPDEGDFFHFVTPFEEPDLHRQGRLRIDPFQSVSVSFAMLNESPTILKTLTRGTTLDTQVVSKLMQLTKDDSEEQEEGVTKSRGKDKKSQKGRALGLGDYWKDLGLHCGAGFMDTGADKEVDEDDDGGKDERRDCAPIRALGGYILPTLPHRGFQISPKSDGLEKFAKAKLHRQRSPEIYKTPLVLVSEAPGKDRSSPKARLALGREPIIYTESFTGFSCHGHPTPELLAKYVFIVMNSSLPRYYQLMTSTKFGVERRAIAVKDVTSFPIIRLEHLSTELLRRVAGLADTIISENSADWNEIDKLVFEIYGLTPLDCEVIYESLEMASPWKYEDEVASKKPDTGMMEAFAGRVQKILAGLTEDDGLKVEVMPPPDDQDAWRFLEIRPQGVSPETSKLPDLMKNVTKALADEEGASVIVAPHGPNCITFAMLAQARYWTQSRARLMSHEIIKSWDELDKVGQRVEA